MTCPKCGCENVNISTSTYNESKSRSFLWNLFMLFITAGLWFIWMLIRKKKEKTIVKTIATCQQCGFSWDINSKSKMIMK